jgi:putative oxidoreductase
VKGFWLLTLPRLTLGLIFLVGAMDGFVFISTGAHLVHPPTALRGLQFEEALKAAGFLWPLMKTVELVGAACLLTNRAPALGLALLSPVIAVVVLFHAVLNPAGIPLAVVLVVCGALLLRSYRPRFARLLDHGAPPPGAAA